MVTMIAAAALEMSRRRRGSFLPLYLSIAVFYRAYFKNARYFSRRREQRIAACSIY